MNDNRYHFVYTDVASGQDKQFWVHADGYARAYDMFWEKFDGEDITNIEVEESSLQEEIPGIGEYTPTRSQWIS